MNKKTGPYHVVDFPPERRVMADFLDLMSQGSTACTACWKWMSPVARQFIEDYKAQTGELLSFTGYLISCLARAVDEDKAVQAYRKGRKQLVVFDDVDVGIMVERKIGEKRVLMGACHPRRQPQDLPGDPPGDPLGTVQPVPASAETASWFRSALLLPWPLSRLFRALPCMAIRRDPTIVTSMAGTVGITAVGMFGKGHGGWGICSRYPRARPGRGGYCLEAGRSGGPDRAARDSQPDGGVRPRRDRRGSGGPVYAEIGGADRERVWAGLVQSHKFCWMLRSFPTLIIDESSLKSFVLYLMDSR